MKHIRFFPFLIGLWLIGLSLVLKAQTADLTIQISGLQVQKGKMQQELDWYSD